MRVDFDATQVPEAGGFEIAPAGWHTAIITAEEERTNAKGTGTFLQLTWTVSGGNGDGTTVRQFLNLNNPSAKAVEIAKQDLAAICIAVGRPRVADTSELLGLSAAILVEHEVNNGKTFARVARVGPVSTKSPGAKSPVPPVKSPAGRDPWGAA